MNDKRYSIKLEFCGYKEVRHVFRFCDKFISQHLTKREAQDAIILHKKNREAIL